MCLAFFIGQLGQFGMLAMNGLVNPADACFYFIFLWS
jgi:hypothetical protein